jgi:ferric-dicitrate binding protein FerR (iron transport regulator)
VIDERMRNLMMAALDGEIAKRDRRELDAAIEASDDLEGEWDRLQRLKEVTGTMRLESPPDRIWQDYWSSVYSRMERGVAWIFLTVGAVVLVSWSVWQAVDEIFQSSDAPWFLKVGTVSLIVGTVILLVSVIREKVFVNRRNPYKDVHQ